MSDDHEHGGGHPCSGEKAFLSRTAEEIDKIYSEELEQLRQDLISQGVDVTSGEGLKTFILAVRKLSERFK
ncbi:MAG: hypothetical protein M0024_06800 [Nitrospiraceae bacterium]|nr:hypothetical protein [Nitrospiraceae bacterium]